MWLSLKSLDPIYPPQTEHFLKITELKSGKSSESSISMTLGSSSMAVQWLEGGIPIDIQRNPPSGTIRRQMEVLRRLSGNPNVGQPRSLDEYTRLHGWETDLLGGLVGSGHLCEAISAHDLGGGNSNIICFYPDPWGNDPNLTSISFRSVGSTTY